MKSIIAENTKRIIRDKGLKQGAVAKRGNYSVNEFSNMMTGRKKITDIDILRIAKALNVSPNELFGIGQ